MTAQFGLSVIGFLLLAASLAAQGKVVPVHVEAADNDLSRAVAIELRGKLGSTLRYALTEVKDAVLLLNVVCMPIDDRGHAACASPTDYYSNADSGAHDSVQSGVSVGSVASVSEAIFNIIITNTSDAKLEEIKKRIDEVNLASWMKGYMEGRDYEKEHCAPKK